MKRISNYKKNGNTNLIQLKEKKMKGRKSKSRQLKVKDNVLSIYEHPLKGGIRRSKEFEKKKLPKFAVNVGLKCSNDCKYCSSGSMLRTHSAFKGIGRSAFDNGYAIVDPDIVRRVAHDARAKRKRGMVQLCTTVDAYCPAARKYGLGRKCLEAILAQSDWQVRILTKNAEVVDDFDIIKGHRDRVLVGLSITAPPAKSKVMSVVEPNASTNVERMKVLRKAHRLGLRTYAMLCPLLPGIADSPEQIDRLVKFAEEIGAESIFAEPVNPRGKALKLTQEALEEYGYVKESKAVAAVRNRQEWSRYVAELISNIQRSVRRHSNINKLRFLLYPSGLSPQHLRQIKKNSRGVIWL